MLELKVEQVANGYVVYSCGPYPGAMCTAQHVATDVHALGLLIKRLAGAANHKQCQAKRKL